MRLIDADVFEKNLENEWRLQEISNNDLTQVREWLAQEQTVDAVPVIRCKDCKYYFKSDEKCQLIDTRLHFYETDKRWADDSFCSWAERKENDKAN